MPVGFLFSLLGIGKRILGFIGAIIKWIADFAQKNPLLFIAILVDIALIYGCYRGYQWHQTANEQAITIKDLKAENQVLGKRLKEYDQALHDAQKTLVDTIKKHNSDVRNLQAVAEEQLKRAQAEAAKTKAARDELIRIRDKYANPGKNCGTAEARLLCEQRLNREFIRDMQKVKK